MEIRPRRNNLSPSFLPPQLAFCTVVRPPLRLATPSLLSRPALALLFAFRRIRSLQLAPDRFWKGHSFDRLVCRWYGTRAKIVATCGIRACQGPEPARSIVGVVFILPLEQLQNRETGRRGLFRRRRIKAKERDTRCLRQQTVLAVLRKSEPSRVG